MTRWHQVASAPRDWTGLDWTRLIPDCQIGETASPYVQPGLVGASERGSSSGAGQRGDLRRLSFVQICVSGARECCFVFVPGRGSLEVEIS